MESFSSSSKQYFLKFFLITLFTISSSTFSTTVAGRGGGLGRPIAKPSTDFIRRSCRETTYPRLCFSSLSVHATQIQTSPQLLAGTALNVTLSSAKATSITMVKLSLRHGLKPREISAMKDCIEELSQSVEELRKSIGEMSKLIKGRNNVNLMVNDIQTWISAALTDENTCTDGFQDKTMNGNLKTVVRGRIVSVAQLTSNALALINRYALIHG